jgi:putative ABC transport system permease protein
MHDWKTASFIAYRSITRGSKSMLILMIFILSLSFLNMMFISGVLSGLWNSEVQLSINLMAADLTISPQRTPTLKQFIENQKELRAEIETIPGVIATARHYQLAGSLSFDKDKNGQYKSVSGAILATDPSSEAKVTTFKDIMLSGQMLSDIDTDKIVLSSALAGGYGTPSTGDLGGVRVGDKVQITYSNGIIRMYTVKGIYNDMIGIYETFITSKEAESLLDVTNDASQILVKADLSHTPILSYQNRVKAMAPNLTVQNYNDLLGSVASFEQALNLISDIVSAISVMVAAITIFVLIYVNAINKRRQIGILKAIGIKQQIIVNSYIIQSLFYTLCGLVIGSGVVFGLLGPFLSAFPIPLIVGLMNLTLAYTPLGIAVSILCFIVAGYLAGRIPARIVAKEDILKAIWG